MSKPYRVFIEDPEQPDIGVLQELELEDIPMFSTVSDFGEPSEEAHDKQLESGDNV